MQRLSEEIRQNLKKQLRALPIHGKMLVIDTHERNYLLDWSRRMNIPVFTHKLANGGGVEVTRLKVTPIRKCPNCGYKHGATVQ